MNTNSLIPTNMEIVDINLQEDTSYEISLESINSPGILLVKVYISNEEILDYIPKDILDKYTKSN